MSSSAPQPAIGHPSSRPTADRSTSPQEEPLVIGVVEDSDEDFAIFSRVFRRVTNKAAVQRWTRAEAALDSLTTGALPRRPDVLVVDLSLPGIDGCELVRRLRKHPEISDVPMFMLSGSGRQLDIDRCLEAGATGYFSKSAHAAELHDTLGQILSAAEQSIL